MKYLPLIWMRKKEFWSGSLLLVVFVLVLYAAYGMTPLLLYAQEEPPTQQLPTEPQATDKEEPQPADKKEAQEPDAEELQEPNKEEPEGDSPTWEKWVKPLAALTALGFFVAFLWVFTRRVGGEEDPKRNDDTQSKDETTRLLMVRFSYSFMFLALFGTIVLFLLSFWGEVEKEKDIHKPLAVFRACWDSANGRGQGQEGWQCAWALNIGGIVSSNEAVSSVTDKGGGRPVNVACKQIQACLGETARCVDGGLVVPLYFVILALIGGAVSLTRRVPEYQKRSALSYEGTEAEPKLRIGLLRELLVFQIVQFISAPFIAVVAYYLLSPGQVSYTVALGFTAGFASETILLMIRAIVQKINPGDRKTAQVGSISGVVVDKETKVGREGVEVKIVGSSLPKVLTGPHGYFSISDVPIGQHGVQATLTTDGQQSAVEEVEVDAEKMVSIDIEL